MRFPIPESALAQHTAVFGKTGSGKTSTAKLIVERVVEQGARVCVLDPIKSDWWGLTSSADGKRAGLPFCVLGGPHGHVPLHASTGKPIGELVGRGDLPLSIIDMADFEPGGAQRFFVDFADILMRRMRGVLYLVIEEAHEFAPKERAGIGAENLSIHYAKKLATAGRSKGIRLIVVTHRVQALHNAVLGSCETIVAHRLTAPADQTPVTSWLKGNVPDASVRDQVIGSLASLRTGTGWVCSGEAQLFARFAFPRISTYDNTATPTEDGEAREVKTAPVDRERLAAIIGSAVEEARANDPTILRERIRELEARLEAIPDAAVSSRIEPDPAALEEARRAGYGEALRAKDFAVTPYVDRLREMIGHVDAIASDLRSVEKGLHGLMIPDLPQSPISSHVAPVEKQIRVDWDAAKQSIRADGAITGGKRRMLTALAQHGAMDDRKLSLLTGIAKRGGTWRTYIGQLRASGLIEGAKDRMQITAAGRKALGQFDPITREGAVAYWRSLLGETGKRAIFDFLLANRHRAVPQEEVARHCNIEPTGGTWRTYIGELRGLGLVVGSKELRAAEEFLR